MYGLVSCLSVSVGLGTGLLGLRLRVWFGGFELRLNFA